MFYPYSQQNIPADAPGYYPPKTDVSIEPSYSYELQPQSYVQGQNHGAQQPPEVLDVPKHGAHGGYEEPVIVLRIPGPTKYASHLQTLLQQYLEIRAAQYLRILEENELHKQQHQHTQQHLEQQQQEHILQQQQQQQQQHEQQAQLYEQQAQLQHGGAAAQAYAEPTLELQPPAHEQHGAQHAPAVSEEHGYSPEVTYAHQIAPTPQPVAYPEVDEIYQGYNGKLHVAQAALQQQQQQHHEQQQQQQVAYAPQQHEEAPEPQQLQHGQQYFVQTAPPAAVQQFFYTPRTQFGAHGSHHYQNVYFMAIAPQSGYATHGAQAAQAPHAAALQHQPIYVQEEEHEQELQQQHHQHQQHQEAQHEIAAAALGENNPRQTHTKVIYTHNSDKGAADYTGSYALPSLGPYERHAAAYHHQQQLQEQLLHVQQQQQQHEQLEQLEQLEQQQQFDYDTPLTHAASEHEQEHEQEHERSAAITPQPFNYHAHGAKALRRVNRKRGVTALKTTTAATTDVQVDEHLQKIREFVRENLGAQMSTAVEFKTTALVKS